MEYILNQNFEKSRRMVLLACVVSIAMIFGTLNPISYITDRDTPREISSMGKEVSFEMTAAPSGCGYSENISYSARMLQAEKNFAGNAMLNNSAVNVSTIANQALANIPITSKKVSADTVRSSMKTIPGTITTPVPEHASETVHGKVAVSEIDKVSDAPGVIKEPGTDDVSDIVPGAIVNPAGSQDDVLDEPAYIEIRGMKIDSEGYVTEIVSGISDGLLVFPTDVRCKGIRAEAVEKLDTDLKDEVMEIWIPANITYIEEGSFNSLKNVNFIESADGNPAYYSETGILYHTDGSVACMPQRRVR